MGTETVAWATRWRGGMQVITSKSLAHLATVEVLRGTMFPRRRPVTLCGAVIPRFTKHYGADEIAAAGIEACRKCKAARPEVDDNT